MDKTKALISAFFLFLVLPVCAQTGKLFDPDHQLSSSFTSQVFQDHDGLIWVLTRNGINRYDGYQFHTIKKEQGQQDGITSNYANCITQDDDGLIYLGMYGALLSYDGRQFANVEVRNLAGTPVDCYMTCFLRRQNGDILAGTSGHGVLKILDRTHAVQVDGPLRDVHTVYSMVEDRRGNVWMVTNRMGLIEYDGKTIRRYFSSGDHHPTLRRLCMDREGNLYVGTTDDGMYMRPAGSDDFRHVDATGHKHISALCLRRDSRLMIGYDGLGVSIYDPKTGQLDDNPYYSRDVDLRKSKVYSILEDINGNVWLGLLQKGIFMQPKETAPFHYMGYKLGALNQIGQACVNSTLIDRQGRFWVGTDKDGLYLLDRQLSLLKHYQGDDFPTTVMSLTEDPQGNIWVGSFGQGFGHISADGQKYIPYPSHTKSSIFRIAATQKGELWVATMGQGLLRIDRQTQQLRTYTAQANASYDSLANCLVNDYITNLSLSPNEKRVYVATSQGLCCLDIEGDSWTSVFGRNCLRNGQPTRIAKEFAGRIWIGTRDGLFCYDLQKKVTEQYTIENGLTDNGVASIEQDREGRLWIGTDHGLCCHDPKNGQTEAFFVDNGLQSNEFCDGASSSWFDGHRTSMLFGGVGGITWFDPEQIKPEPWDAEVRLVEFLVNGVPVNSSSRSHRYQICDTTTIAASGFQLSHQDNTFTVRFSTLTYDNPEHTTYIYSINDEPFTRLRNGVNELTFTHMQPGTYHFRVKAERYNRLTGEREFTVVIHGPWYATWWAQLIFLTLLAAVIWRYIHLLKRKEQDRLRIKEHMYAEEMSNAKLRFFTNISHEIRTPMTLIITPLLSLIKDEDDPQRKSVFEAIKRNAERILHLIDQIMDLRKIDRGLMQMRMTETDLVGFVNDIFSLFEHQAKARQMTLTFEHEMDALPVWIDRKNFDKVIMNILSNAFKFTPTGGTITIRLDRDGGNAVITVSDNGEKIPEDKLDRIFERFYQVSTSVNDRNAGTGIGLDLARSLVELHHGTISAHNLEQGCEFVVTIPLGNSHLSADEMVYAETTGEASLLYDELHDEENATAKSAGERKTTLVIAEDDSEICDYLVKELEGEYQITAVNNGKDALSATLRQLPDLVLSDVMMPEMDGITLCSRIKTNPSTRHIPVVLLTAKNRDEDKLEGLDTGADAYFVKPFNMDLLRRTISNIINSHLLLRFKYERNDNLEEKINSIQMKSPDEKLMERVIQIINRRLSDSNLSVDMIASEVGISRVHLYRKMKELTGQTPHEFIRNIRLKNAASLLAKKSMNVSEVTYACGFANTASFSIIFKKFYGVSPRDYIKEQGQ